MDNVTMRPVKEGDLSALKMLIAQAFGKGWNLSQFDQNADYYNALLEIYLSIFLDGSTFGKVAVVNGEVVGVVLCSAKGQVKKFRRLQKDMAVHTFALLSAPEPARTDITEHMSTSFAAIGQLLENKIDSYQGSLELLIVSHKAQGLGLGKALWGKACGYFASKGVQSIYLYTDSSCNVGFYDYNGFARVSQGHARYNFTQGQQERDIYLYEYRL